jgi:hypothetical protein
VYSVADDEEARMLIATGCPRDNKGTYYARELAQEQTLENLKKFSDKLDTIHKLFEEKGLCRCRK